MRSSLLCALFVVVALGVLGVAGPASAHAASTSCPGTFQVLGNDRVGSLKLAAGAYRITPTGVTCSQATTLFTRFLNDFDGTLPSPWKVTSSGFVKGSSSTGFNVALVTPSSAGSCAGTFPIYEPVTVGGLQLTLGQYALAVSGGLSCTTANNVFAQAADTAAVPSGWSVNAATSTFTRGGQRFTATNAGSAPSGIGRSTGTRCPGTFRVEHNDRIGSLKLPAGAYLVNLLPGAGLSCPVASDLLALFLARPGTSLPSPWRLNAQTGTFTRGSGSTTGFLIEPSSVAR